MWEVHWVSGARAGLTATCREVETACVVVPPETHRLPLLLPCCTAALGLAARYPLGNPGTLAWWVPAPLRPPLLVLKFIL